MASKPERFHPKKNNNKFTREKKYPELPKKTLSPPPKKKKKKKTPGKKKKLSLLNGRASTCPVFKRCHKTW